MAGLAADISLRPNTARVPSGVALWHRGCSSSGVTMSEFNPSFRLEVCCDGLGDQYSLQGAVHQVALRELESHATRLRLANVRVERSRGDTHVCHVQLFGHGLDHVAGHSEHPKWQDAVSTAAHRAVRALEAQDRFDPWTSEPPSSHRRRQ
jgi:hypothetical protein